MARKLRVEYPGAIYHLMSRGDHRELIKLIFRFRVGSSEAVRGICFSTMIRSAC